jgi:hypothetical protein
MPKAYAVVTYRSVSDPENAAARTQRRSSAKWRCGVRNMPKFAKLTEQSN